MDKLVRLFKKKPYLAWYTREAKNLSEESMLEHILNYGDWSDYKTAEEAFGLSKTRNLYQKLKNKKRVNLRPQTVNYFNLYFQKYA